MLSKNLIKSVTALHHKKFRREENLFIAEGEKIVFDLLDTDWKVVRIFGTQKYFQNFQQRKISKQTEIELVSEDELKKLSALTSPQDVLAVCEIQEPKEINYDSGLKLVLDGISDPGNLGTLIRIADWFGIDEIICSEDTADCFNPKVVQASMGSLFHVNISYINLKLVFEENLNRKKLHVYGTVMDGKNLYEAKLVNDGFIIAGNESKGIQDFLLKYITDSLTIPSYKGNKAESLNVAVATAIVCAEFRKVLINSGK